MVNTNYGYSVAINNNSSGDNSSNHNMEDFRVIDDCRQNQQSSPDSQYEGDSGSLSVMRRREPLGASGNKPERPKQVQFKSHYGVFSFCKIALTRVRGWWVCYPE